MPETNASEISKRLAAEGRPAKKAESAPVSPEPQALKPPHTPDDGHDHGAKVTAAKQKADRLAEKVAIPLMAGGFVAASAVEKGSKLLDTPLERLEKWGDKHAKKLGDVPFIGGMLVWAFAKLGVVSEGGGGHDKKDDHGKKADHGKKDDHGKKGGGGHH